MVNELFKSFTMEPSFILSDDSEGEILEEQNSILEDLRNDLITVTEMAEWILRDDHQLLDDLEEYDSQNLKNAKIGERLGVKIPDEVKGKRVIGGSRFETLVLDRAIGEARSWRERVLVAQCKSKKYVSQGWKRTANATRPTDLIPKFNLGSVNSQYASIVNNPFDDHIIVLRMVINRQWYRLVFSFPKRFHDAKRISLPVVRVAKSGRIVFDFCAIYDYLSAQFSPDYIVGVDVGIKNYATVVVRNVKTREIAFSTTLSQRVHSLANSIKSSERQKKSLLLKENRDAILHRRAASRKKRELAIIAGQEIAQIAHEWGNSIVVFEDLSWIKNTMQNGRWNRGELVKRTTEFVELNGSRVFKVNSANTSTHCHICGKKGVFVGWSVLRCVDCGVNHDRDVNAAMNVAHRAEDMLVKSIKTRSKSKSLVKNPVKRTPTTRHSLKRPRCKNKATPKQRRGCNKVSNVPRIPEHAGTVYAVVSESNSLIKTQKAGRINTNAKEILYSIKTLE